LRGKQRSKKFPVYIRNVCRIDAMLRYRLHTDTCWRGKTRSKLLNKIMERGTARCSDQPGLSEPPCPEESKEPVDEERGTVLFDREHSQRAISATG
jgi:hypothetical protein